MISLDQLSSVEARSDASVQSSKDGAAAGSLPVLDPLMALSPAGVAPAVNEKLGRAMRGAP